MKKFLLTLLAMVMLLPLTMHAQSTCTAPTGLTTSMHSPNWQNVQLNWNPVVNTTAQNMMWSTQTYSTRVGTDGAADFVGSIRFETTDLTAMSGYVLQSVAFVPGEAQSVCTYYVEVWQGGSYDATLDSLIPGTLILEQQITAPLTTATLNTVNLNTPVTVDPTQELWIGIRCNTTAGFPLGASANPTVANKGELLMMDSSWTTLSAAGLTGYNWLIIGTFVDANTVLSGYNVARDNTTLNATPLASTSYLDSVANGTYNYEVTAVYANGCISDPISATVTMADDPCIDCLDSTIVGTGTSSTYSIPINTFYNYSYSQQIYTAAELNGIVGRIPCISFQYIYTSPQSKNIVIYMGNTSKNAFANSTDWIPVSEMYQVFNGTINFTNAGAGNWVNIPLDVPFEWDGSSNVVVAVLNNTGSYVSSSNSTFTYHDATNKTLYAQNDGSAYTPASGMSSGSLSSYRNNIRFMEGEPVLCPMPSHYTVANITHEGATASWWSRGVEGGYEVVLVPEGSSFASETPVFVSDTFYTMTGLTDNTGYTLYMRALCSGENSTWLQTSFHTTCLPVDQLPYVENFDADGTGTAAFPSCWTKVTTSTNYPYISANGANNSTGCLYFYSYSGAYAYAILPPMDATLTMSELQVNFKAKKTSDAYGHIEVGVMTDPADVSTFTLIKSLSGSDYASTNTWYDFIAYLNNYTGAGRYIAFRSPGDYSSYTYLDNVEVKVIAGCGTPVNFTVDNTAGTSALLSWNASDLSTPSDVYTVEYSEQGQGNWTPVTTTSTSILLSGLNPLTYYDVRLSVTCDNGTSDYVTNSFLTTCLAGGDIEIGTGTTTSSYFPQYSTYNYSFSQQIYPSSDFNGANTLHSIAFYCSSNPTPTRTLDIYLMHTTQNTMSSWLPMDSAVKVFTGTHTMTIGWNVFDFDTIFDYNGMDNLVVAVNDRTGSWSSGNYYYVHTGASGCSRYVYEDGSQYNPMNMTSTGSSSSYLNNVIFGGACDSVISCVAPALYLNNLSSSSADLVWAPGYQETSWELEYREASDSAWISEGTVTTTNYTLSNLTPSTTYVFRMRSNCGGEYSEYVGLTFTTECVTVDALPYMENFDSYTTYAIPDCWSRLYTYTSSSTAYPYITSSYAQSGSYSLYFYNGGSSYYSVAATPRFGDMIEMDSLVVAFSTYFGSTSYYLEVGIMEDPTDASTFTLLETIHPTATSTWEPQEVITRNYAGNGHFVAFRVPVGTYNYAYLDNLNIYNIPSCPHITNLAATGIDSAEVTLTWTAGGSEQEWQIIIIPTTSSVDLDTCTVAYAYQNSYTEYNLQPSTQYTAYVRADCGGEYSNWMTIDFMTSQIPGQLPYECDFEMANTGWGFANGACANKWFVGTATNNGGTHALYVSSDNGATNSYNTSSASNVWAYRDIYFPASAYGYQFSFDWKNYGESCCDYMQVYIGNPATPTPGSSNITPTGATQITTSNLNLQSNFTTFTSTINGFTTAGVRRIYFLWHNDGSVGSTPPGAIDNVYIANITCPSPTGVTVSSITANSANVNWTENGTATNWTLQYKVSTDQNWIDIPNATNPYQLSGLTPYTNYIVRVSSDCGNGESSPASAPQNFTTLATCPAPTNLTISGTTQTSVDLSWTEMGSASTWNVIYGTTGFNPATGGTTVVANTNSTTITGLSDAITYDFYVQADCGGGDLSVWTGPVTTAPGAINMPATGSQTITACGGHIYDDGGPTGSYSSYCNSTLTINPSNTGEVVQVTGTFYLESSFDYIEIYDGTSASGTMLYSTSGTSQGTIPATTSTTGSLTIHMVSDGSVQNSGFDLTVSCVTGGGPVVTCDAPTALGASNVAQTSATISWTAGGSETAWNLQYKTANATSWGSTVNVTNNPTHNLTGLAAGTAYNVRVQANCGNGETSDWTMANFTTQEETDCPMPTNFRATDVNVNSVTLAWDQQAGTANEWEINYKRADATTWTNITVNANPYTITDLTATTAYQAQILAHCTSGVNSDATEIITFTTTGVNDYLLDNNTVLYPNPTTGIVTVHSSQFTVNTVNVYDVYGKLLMSVEVNANVATIDATSLAAGVYFAKIETEKGVVTKRFVKK